MEVNATIPGAFHHLSSTIVFSFFQHISLPAVRQHIFTHHLHSSTLYTGSVKSHIHIMEFAIVLGQYSYFYRLGETGCYNSLPLKGTSSSMFYLSIEHVSTEVNKIGYACFMASSISQVASSGPKCFHCTLTCAMVRFLSGVSFLSNMHWGYGRNSPPVPPRSQTSELYD